MAKIVVVYYSQTGNTQKMAELVAAGCREVAGVQVQMAPLPGPDAESLAGADGFALGSPDYYSYMAGHMKTFFDGALAHKSAIAGKPYVAFGSHGGGARVLESLERLSQAIGLRQVQPGIMCMGAPAPGEEEAIRALGRALAEAAAG
jgi:flavorubredoxin